MQIVINISEKQYEIIKELVKNQNNVCPEADSAEKIILKGIPLPKGHGRLIDASKLKVELECGIRAGNYEEGYEKYAHINDMDDCVDAVEYADTIIEADKMESEDKK